MDVGFMGLGAMGRPMARNLSKTGHRVLAWNRSPIEPPDGVTPVDSPRAVGEQTEVAFVMVSAADAVEQVLFGEDGWTGGAKPGAVIIQSSTIGPTAAERLGSRVEAAGFGFLDAPVSGSVKPAENAQLTVLGGGDQAIFDRYETLLEAIAARTVVFGPIGSGSAVKLAVNGLLVSVLGATAESLSWLIDRQPGLDVKAFASVIERISPIAAARSETIAGSAAAGGFALRQAAKDMELVGEEFGAGGVMEVVRGLTRAGLELDFGDLDVACLGAVVRSRTKA
ncbi:MAG: NAD(P)-dependent oxidoreductase [Acidimicrobiia bacterium]|nr:NAD(P)-dependent oxidoreductase [Acidimicrobiia bacterium]MDH3398543.1 NAD(P)-dependent oxidoreductase [Acidimicrobiia bacterium]MDH5615527.1 NAD(P)-dependent oxidoreductase [Acidimicrobiia bacterium]